MLRVVCRPEHIVGGEAETAGVGQPGGEKAQGALMYVRKYLTGGHKGARPFSAVPRERAGSNGIG